jgi:ribosome-binding protein aMBF1 (putative translation factor)
LLMSSHSLPKQIDGAPRIRCEVPKPRMAKADLEPLTLREDRANYGAILRRASELAGMNRDETADALKVDKAQVSRWWSGDENAQTWRYHRHPKLKLALLKAQGNDATDTARVKVRTVIEIEEWDEEKVG